MTAAPAVPVPCLRCGTPLSAPGYCSRDCWESAQGGYVAGPVRPAPALPGYPGPAATSRPASESGLAIRIALGFALAVLAFDVGFQHVSDHATADVHQTIEYAVRKLIALDVGFYLSVGIALMALVHVTGLDLVFVRKARTLSILGGLAAGTGLGLGLLAVSKATTGHVQPDSRLVLPIGEGGFLRVGLMVVISCALAPLVEETLFRGVLAGSLLPLGRTPAILLSAVAFAVWHWMLQPPTLVYYTLVGCALAAAWQKFGLLGSMSMHAAFNGVIVAAVVVVTSGPGQAVHVGDLTLTLPGGWHQTELRTAPHEMHYAATGPTLSELVVDSTPDLYGATPATVLRGLLPGSAGGSVPGSVGALPGLTVLRGGERRLPGGDAVVADVQAGDQAGQLVIFTTADGDLWTVLGLEDGSGRAARDWAGIVGSLRWGATAPATGGSS